MVDTTTTFCGVLPTKWSESGSSLTLQIQITRRMQGIVGASGKFILFLSSMVLFIIISKNIHAHMRTIARI